MSSSCMNGATRVSWTIQITELVYLDDDERGKDFDEAQRSTAGQAPHQRQLLGSEKLLRLGGCRHRGALSRADCSDHRRRTGNFQKG